MLWTCSAWQAPQDPDRAGAGSGSTYQRLLGRAQAGDAESQNAVAYMLYHGEGAPQDSAQAREWFARAAMKGNERARRNLASMALLPAPAADARRPASGGDLRQGEQLYLTFCSGCHGVNGISAYEHSPSFAFGERLEKGDAQLMRSLSGGSQEMPGWDGQLTRGELLELLAFVRTLRERYEAGIAAPLRAAPSSYYLFGPMEARRLGASAAPR